MDCDFNPSKTRQRIRRTQGTKRYWRSSSGEETTQEKDGFDERIEGELVNELDEHGRIQWEDDPSGATERAYIELDAEGVQTDNHVHNAAFVEVRTTVVNE